MNKYVVAYLDLNQGDLKQELVEASSRFEAMVSYLGWTKEDLGDTRTCDQLEEAVFNMDSYISVFEIKASKKNSVKGFPSISAGLND
jgi:hypothetical protein